MVLVDTSIWVDHLRTPDAQLATLIEAGEVVTHAFVLGELALGCLKQRSAAFEALCHLPGILLATDAEVRLLIEQCQLLGSGIGYVDAHLMASVYLTPGCSLLTRDRRLQSVATDLGRATTLKTH
jgi:predicted nucleic acid-binding protein